MHEQFFRISSKLRPQYYRMLGMAMLPAAGLIFFGLPARSGDRPNVVLISIDTLRADHVGAYGYKRDTTPRIDAWARDAVRFEQATSTANTTLPAHMSMFTSLHPEAHGVVEDAQAMPRISNRRVTLPEKFRSAGYETAAFVRDCTWMDAGFGFDRGFELYSVTEKNAREVNDEHVLPWLRRDHEQPFFLFIHYYDVHSDWTQLPYEAPSPFNSQFTADYRGSFNGCGDGVCASQYLQSANDHEKPLSTEDLAYISDLYDNGIAFTDSEVGRVLYELSTSEQLKNTIVVLVGDHGEEFREHGKLGHTSLYQHTIRVPWIISWPGRLAPAVVKSPVQTLDLMPTLLQLTGLPSNQNSQGVSRVEELLGRVTDPGRALFSTMSDGPQFAVQKGPWKLIVNSKSGHRELYKLDSDPNETNNLAERHASLTKELATRIEFFRTDSRYIAGLAPPATQGVLTAEHIERRASLGYSQ